MAIEVVKDREHLLKDAAEIKVRWALEASKILVSEYNLNSEYGGEDGSCDDIRICDHRSSSVLSVASMLLAQLG